MNVSVRDMERTLLGKLGFVQSERDHHVYQLLDIDGRKVVRTKLSHGSRGKGIKKGIFGAIARQTQLTKGQLQDAVKCPLSRRDYSDILKKKNLIDFDLP